MKRVRRLLKGSAYKVQIFSLFTCYQQFKIQMFLPVAEDLFRVLREIYMTKS